MEVTTQSNDRWEERVMMLLNGELCVPPVR